LKSSWFLSSVCQERGTSSRLHRWDSTFFSRMHCFAKRSVHEVPYAHMWKFPRSLFMTLSLIYHRGILGCQYISPDYLRLGIPCSVRHNPYSGCALQVVLTWLKIHPVPNHGFFCFASMPQRIVENEQSDIALLKSRQLSV
jgi:hypothetical protein